MTTLIVDGNNLAMKSIFAMRRSGLSAHGVPTGPLMTAINSFSKLIGAYEPSHMFVAWDGGRSEMRLAIDASYKAHRAPVTDAEKEFRDSSFDLIKRFLTLAGIEQEQATNVEADDLIAAAWAGTSSAEHRIVIASSDKDFLQLTGTSPEGVLTELDRFDPGGDVWTEERVIGEMGCTPAQLPLVMALTGDEIDGVPGVPGIGPKRALATLRAAKWDLEAASITLSARQPEAASLERLRRNHALVNLRDPAWTIPPLSWAPPEGQQYEALLSFLEQFELSSIAKKLQSGALWRPLGAPGTLPGRTLRPRKGR